MSGHEKLCPNRSPQITLADLLEKRWMDEILGFLNPDQRGRIRIAEQDEISEEFEGAVGNELRHYGIFESTIF